MAAAPHLFDDVPVASPELALVDVDLAAQLREEIRTDEQFRPRTVARPEFHLLHSVEIADDVDEDDVAVDDVVELSEYVVAHDEIVVEVDPVVVALGSPPAAPAVDELATLPDYILATEELPDAVVVGGEPFLDVALDPPAVAETTDLPDYIVADEMADEVGVGSALLDVALDPPAAEVSDLPDYIVLADDLRVEDVPDAAAHTEGEAASSDYPVLPDLGEASAALDETDVALRKIREQLASEEPSRRHRRVRWGFIAASGLGAFAALAVFAVDVQQGVATLPGWLGF